jgi:CheY-like chemotaxis protein
MKSILVIEDDDAIRESLVEILTDEGYHVSAAEHGRRAIEILRALGDKTPSLILLDLTMPVMSGLEFLEVQKADPTWKKIPTIVFTAAGGRQKPPLAEGFLRKPLQIEDLLKTLETFLVQGNA